MAVVQSSDASARDIYIKRENVIVAREFGLGEIPAVEMLKAP